MSWQQDRLSPDTYCAVAIAVHGEDSIEAFESCEGADNEPCTDLPLEPVPFADRTASPLWASLTPRETPRLKECAGCGQARHLGAYRADAATFDGLSHECRRCHNRKRRAAA